MKVNPNSEISLDQLELDAMHALPNVRAYREGTGSVKDVRAALRMISRYVRARESARVTETNDFISPEIEAPRGRARAQRRANYELDVLQTTVFHTGTKAEARRAAVKFAYDHVLAERIANTSETMKQQAEVALAA